MEAAFRRHCPQSLTISPPPPFTRSTTLLRCRLSPAAPAPPSSNSGCLTFQRLFLPSLTFHSIPPLCSWAAHGSSITSGKSGRAISSPQMLTYVHDYLSPPRPLATSTRHTCLPSPHRRCATALPRHSKALRTYYMAYLSTIWLRC